MPTSNCDTSKLTRKSQIGGRVENEHGVAETLNAFDFKTRMYVGATPDYDAGRVERDLARDSLTRIGSIEGKKSTSHSYQTEINTPDNWNIAATADLDVESIEHVTGQGSRNRITFNGSPDLSGVVPGDYITVNYDANAINNGTFLIIAVDDGSDTVDIANRPKDSATGDTSSGSTGVGDIQSAFELAWAFQGSGCRLDGLSRLPIGAISNESVHHGQTIVGGTSSAEGTVIVPAKDGDSHIYFLPTSGIFQAEAITVTGSTATFTSSGGPEVHGMAVRPTSDCQEVVTVEYQEDGYAWSSRSAMGNFVGNWEANAIGFLQFDFNGPRLTNGDKDLTSGVVRGQEDPPIMKTADLTFDADSGSPFKPVFTSVNFDAGNNVILRENGNAPDDTGYETARIPSRTPKVTITLEHELASTFDYFAKLDQGTKTKLELHIGTSANKQFWFFADELEFEALPPEENEDIRMLGLEAMCTGDISGKDDEWVMAFIGD